MTITTESYASTPSGMIPNSRFPLLVHRNAVPGGGAEAIKARFRSNGWSNNWDYPGVMNTRISTRPRMNALGARRLDGVQPLCGGGGLDQSAHCCGRCDRDAGGRQS